MFCCASWLVLCISVFVLIASKICNKKPAPMFGVYQRPNGYYWFKFVFMLTILYIKKFKHFLSPVTRNDMNKVECPQKLPPTANAVDAVFFSSANKHGDYFVIGTARRRNRLIDGFIVLKIDSLGLGTLVLPKAPDTALFNSGEEQSYEAEGIKVSVSEPMEKWAIKYEGQLKECNDSKKLHDVKIEATWSSDKPWYNYNTDMVPWEMATGLAYERWSRSYFENSKKFHQDHYEQFGTLRASITIDGKYYKIELDSVRDHSMGEHRDWSLFKRYSLHYVAAENGDQFYIGNICVPLIFSRLKFGHMYNAATGKMYSITDCTFELFNFGEMGQPPDDYAFSFKAGGNEYFLQINVSDSPHFYLSKDCDIKLYERLCTYKVNGKDAWGTTEWVYRNPKGRSILDEEK
ncbi:hypothetical protein GWI33_001684 [Rhynchophorus ferrugineus]|uniref:Uncharacterized protein n=1 Tax=Rhynchophorus ferrugineus TaxID=354439 RepID=A0A834IU93_RHYFE|nr:hypothetical protein GWI33_001684 [Rhynchophorus ferrugineus]